MPQPIRAENPPNDPAKHPTNYPPEYPANHPPNYPAASSPPHAKPTPPLEATAVIWRTDSENARFAVCLVIVRFAARVSSPRPIEAQHATREAAKPD